MQSIVNDLFFSVYQYLGFGIVFAVICMCALPEIEKKGIKRVIFSMGHRFKVDKTYRYRFFFFIILFMVLSRTLICRNIWQCPWENIIGQWGIFTSEGAFNTEGMLNILLFFPISYLGLLGFSQHDRNNREIIVNVIRISFCFSCMIEICQLFFRLGTFQLSDIFQNTFGGFIGAIVYILHRKYLKI